MSPRGGVPERVSAQEENLGTHSTAQNGPKNLGSQQCTPGEGWPDTVPRTRLLGFHPRALPQNRAKPLSAEQPRWPYAGLSTNPRTIGWQTVPGIGLPAWYVGASPQGIQQRSTDSAGTIM